MIAWLAGLGSALAVALLVPGRPHLHRPLPDPGDHPDAALVRRLRWPCALLAAGALPVFVGGPVGWALALPAGFLTWRLASRTEAPHLERDRRRAARELPHLVLLLSAALRSGVDPVRGLALATAALPGPAGDRLGPVLSRLEVGVPAATVWSDLAADPVLGPLGRTLARAAETGAPVAEAVERLADDLADRSRCEVEDRARAVGVRAAVPLGLCLLPAFLLVGIVPLVAGLLATVVP